MATDDNNEMRQIGAFGAQGFDSLRLKLKGRILPYVRRRSFLIEVGEFLTALLFGASAYGSDGFAPLGVACVAAAFLRNQNPYFILFGAATGALLTGSYASAASSALFAAACLLLVSWRGTLKSIEKLAVLLAVQLLLLPVFFMHSLEACMIGLANAALAVPAAAALKNARDALDATLKKRMLTGMEQASVLALCAFFVFSVRDIAPLAVSLGALLAAFFSLCAASVKGPPAVAGAVVLGLTAVVAGGASMFFLGALAACTLLGSFLRRAGRFAVAGGFFVPAALLWYFLGGIGSLSIFEAGLACSAFVLLPAPLFAAMNAAAMPLEESRAKTTLLQTRARLNDIISVVARLNDLYDAADAEKDCALLRPNGLCAALKTAADGYSPPMRRRYEVRYGAAACPKEDNRETGDSIGIREVRGKLLLMLSDGMGTGEAAKRESALTVALLGDLLSVGFELDAALECVNRLLLQRNQNDMYATLDAALIDLSTGAARFLKHGAPPSYLLRDGKVIPIFAEALPMGVVKDARPAVQPMALKHGDAVVLMTDGAVEALGASLIASLLEKVCTANTADDAATALLSAAREKSKADDISILVARVI